ncbi:radical SAM superfamily enzyme [Owenweeksia hongkongensis DSM 17368]|uniref:Radical SAM superfamily enzyme n=1 Tax=Owenweeksia hongkongensis (strain DSM 17368 / CIP 108786 / JCM 12287 / NRRL B-23963 / UST20020801) TaxID=926562 RepID=G8R1C2_OWEHD|nr:radical SAM protein [Owenweeksia hongkongensis]AEV33865.1 radical SAM superfamily enzyme [Owenweeksia hongkongensis DSM 17368]
MTQNFNKYQQIYWAFTQLCNDHCDHCYNSSGPHGERMSEEECLAVVDNLPDQLERLILSGGEPLAERKVLFSILDKLKEKYENRLFITIQFNGDLLTPKILKQLLDKGVDRFSIASIDRYHKKQGERKEILAELFESHGTRFTEGQPAVTKAELAKTNRNDPTFGFFGATEDMWLGGNWARGRAMDNNIWKKDGSHNFCAIHSGAIGFLEPEEEQVQEMSIQLWKINPCCPGTVEPLGDARVEKVAEVLQRATKSEVIQKLNKGDAWGMGESIGISEGYAKQRSNHLQSICLWCDDFFKNHYDIKELKERKRQKIDEAGFIPEKMQSRISIRNSNTNPN